MKKILLFLIAISYGTASFGQEIEGKYNLLGYRLIQNEERLSWKVVFELTESQSEANLLIKRAKTQNTISTVLSLVGGGMIGLQLGKSETTEDSGWTLGYIGSGVALAGFTFAFWSGKNMKKGVDMYNQSLISSNQYRFKPEFEIAGNKNGIGITMIF